MPAYDEGGLLKGVRAKLRGSAEETDFVAGISYNPKGQRKRIKYGNGATTKYEYDENTFRLTKLLTTRNNGTEKLQDLNYKYDPMGNITQIIDDAQQTVYFSGTAVSPSQAFEYDALYRLVKATGREHADSDASTGIEADGYPQSPLPNDAAALRRYTREWEYDEVGNILNLIHKANSSVVWNRAYSYEPNNNQLMTTKIGNDPAVSYAYNEHGSMTKMPHLQNMEWDFAERLRHITRGSTEAYYNYDGGGERVRKVVEKGNIVETRLYLGGFEIFRKKDFVGSLVLERETLHIMDDKKRIALVETLTVGSGPTVPVQRYQLSNNIESATLELDGNAAIISYEEYYPYGDTSYQAGSSGTEVSQKRYRYTGKEKDEESGLYYMLARYYSGWLSRWTAVDPAGLVDGVNLYMYCRGNPVKANDPNGTTTDDVTWDVPIDVQTVDGFRQWVFDNTGAYIDGEVTMERTEGGNPIFNYNDADLTIDEEARVEILEARGSTEESAKTVGQPSFAESFIPIWGSGRDAIHNFQEGNYGWGTFHAVMTATDVFLAGALVKIGTKAIMKGGAKVLAKEAAEPVVKTISKAEINPKEGFKTFTELKKHLGPIGENMQWHHIVEQSQIKAMRSGFAPELIHNPANIIAINKETHILISNFYSSKPYFTNGQTVRNWLSGKSLQEQYDFGLKILKQFGVGL
jgi:RHS repeat-associated protein